MFLYFLSIALRYSQIYICLNQYYFQNTFKNPLSGDFDAPPSHTKLLLSKIIFFPTNLYFFASRNYYEE